MFERVLIVRRGEAAARIARTCKRLGIHAVALYSEPGESVHVEACDEAFQVRADARRVDVAEVLERVKEAKVDAVHPGYGGRPAHRELARALEGEGVPYIGIDPDVVDVVEDPLALRSVAERVGLRVVPARQVTRVDEAAAALEEYGAVHLAGPRGGQGARICELEALEAAWTAREEHANAAPAPEGVERRSGGLKLLAEAWIPRARRVSVLLVADSEGDVAVLGERETSIRGESGEVVVEECPSPELIFRNDGDAIREMMFDVAIRLAAELRFVGLLSLDLLLDPDRALHLAGARLGLPVHHAVVELVTGLDLVALQLQIASGAPIPEGVRTMEPRGHAIAVDVRAGSQEVRPESIESIRFPSAPQRSVRIEPSVVVGVAPAFDDWPRVAKLTSVAPVRHQAVLTLDRVLAATTVVPLTTNVAHLRRVMSHEQFRAGQFDREFIPELVARMESRPSDAPRTRGARGGRGRRRR